jgi:hypothetical protein
MNTVQDRPTRLPWIVATRRNFLWYWLLATGIPMVTLGVWFARDFGGPIFLVFVAVVFALTAYWSGVIMWALFIGPRVGRRLERQVANREA